MSAAITIGFSDREDGDTTLFVTQFVALEKPKPGAADLYTMIVRTYSDDATASCNPAEPCTTVAQTCTTSPPYCCTQSLDWVEGRCVLVAA